MSCDEWMNVFLLQTEGEVINLQCGYRRLDNTVSCFLCDSSSLET